MLNCGGFQDWSQAWFADTLKNIKTYIFDSHRPYAHNNFLTASNIFVIDDGTLPPINDIPDDNDAAQDSERDEAEE